MNDFYYITTTWKDEVDGWCRGFQLMVILDYHANNDYTLIHVDEPNVIGINERMVND